MSFTLFKKEEKVSGKKQVIDSNKALALTLITHCEKLILNLNLEDKSRKLDSNMQKQIEDFSYLWNRLYAVTKLVVNKYCVTNLEKSKGGNILSYISQNTGINTQNPTILIAELKKREALLRKIVAELDLLEN